MRLLDDSLISLCKNGTITAEEAISRAVDPVEMRRGLGVPE